MANLGDMMASNVELDETVQHQDVAASSAATPDPRTGATSQVSQPARVTADPPPRTPQDENRRWRWRQKSPRLDRKTVVENPMAASSPKGRRPVTRRWRWRSGDGESPTSSPPAEGLMGLDAMERHHAGTTKRPRSKSAVTLPNLAHEGADSTTDPPPAPLLASTPPALAAHDKGTKGSNAQHTYAVGESQGAGSEVGTERGDVVENEGKAVGEHDDKDEGDHSDDNDTTSLSDDFTFVMTSDSLLMQCDLSSPGHVFDAGTTELGNGPFVESSSFVQLQTSLKRERLFVSSQKLDIRDLYLELNDEVEHMMGLHCLARQKTWHLYLFLHNHINLNQLVTRMNAIERWQDIELKTASHVLFTGATYLATFFQALIRHADQFASRVMEYCRGLFAVKPAAVENVFRVVFFNLYGNFFLPFDELASCRFLEALLRLQFQQQPLPQRHLALRRSSVFTKAFMIYAKSKMFSGTLFLVTALRDPLLAVLADDDLDLEIDPTVVWSRLGEAQRVRLFGQKHGSIPLDMKRLIDNEAFRSLLDQVYDRLHDSCSQIVERLRASLPSLPYTIRCIVRQVKDSLTELGASASDIQSAMGDLFLLRYVGPAVASPEQYGIITDTPISPTARRNLLLLARLLRDIARGSFESPEEPFMAPLYSRLQNLGKVGMTELFEQLVQVSPPDQGIGYPPGAVNQRGRKPTVVMSYDDANLLKNVCQAAKFEDDVAHACDRVANVAPAGIDPTRLLVFELGDAEQPAGGLLSEKDVVAAQPQNSQATTDSDPDTALLADAATKLRLALSNMNLNPQWQSLGLVELLEAELADASAVGNMSLASYLHEAIRSIRVLPPSLLAEKGKRLYDLLCDEYQQRKAYISYLVATRQSLLTTQELVTRQSNHLELAVDSCDRYFVMLKVTRYLSGQPTCSAVAAFVDQMKGLELVDEKAACFKEFVDGLCEKLCLARAFRDSSEPELEDACGMATRQCVALTYKYSFCPDEQALRKDLVFQQHIRSNLAFIDPNHKDLQIKAAHQREAPWPAAQRALLRINAFKSPEGKLQCVVQCCAVVMELLQLGGQSAGADDLFPVLVYVVLKANPRHILSTIEYITFFGDELLQGEAGYWWTQFCSAVQFIQSIDDRADDANTVTAPSHAQTH
eukprot:m.155433 g.155433  ORF g.155433 m.155433 type:complete len:1144 (+) comp17530_c0_seq1:324-3755(+)